MRKTTMLATTALLALLATGAEAQKMMTVEAGLFGQYTKLDKELQLEDVFSVGGRLGWFLLPNLAAELDGHIGSTDWASPTGTKSITYSPYAIRGVYGIPLTDRGRLRFCWGVRGWLALVLAPDDGAHQQDQYSPANGHPHCQNRVSATASPASGITVPAQKMNIHLMRSARWLAISERTSPRPFCVSAWAWASPFANSALKRWK